VVPSDSIKSLESGRAGQPSGLKFCRTPSHAVASDFLVACSLRVRDCRGVSVAPLSLLVAICRDVNTAGLMPYCTFPAFPARRASAA
jgi:hypothetical protein